MEAPGKKTPPPPPPTEFDASEKTPANALITNGQRKIVIIAVRAFFGATVPLLPKLALAAGPAIVALLLGTFQHWSGKAETEHKTTVAYGTLEQGVNDHAAKIASLQKAVSELAASVALQAQLALASQPGFDAKGKPESAPVAAASAAKKRRARGVAPPADPTIIKKVQEDAAKNQALKAKLAAPVPPAVVVPKELPAEVPKPATPPAPKSNGAEWPPPVPVQSPEAAP